MRRFAWLLTVSLGVGALPHAQTTAPTRVPSSAVIFVEDTDFGRALSAAILKKKVPVLVTTNRENAAFVIEEASKASQEGAAERVTKIVAFGMFAGSGKSYEASVTLTNDAAIVIFAHNSKKSNIRSAAEDVANKLKDHITKR